MTNRLRFAAALLLILSIFTFTYVLPASAKYKEFIINGSISDYQWAHDNQKLALLVYTEAGYQLHIIDALKSTIQNVRNISGDESNLSAIAWSRNDKSLILAGGNTELTTMYEYNLDKETYEIFMPKYKLTNVRRIAFDNSSKYWSYVRTYEGTPGMHINKKHKEIYMTGFDGNIYLNIDVIRWKDGILTCYSDRPLKFVNYRDKRGRKRKGLFVDETGKKSSKYRTYAVNPKKRIITPLDESMNDIRNASFNKMYYIKLEKLDKYRTRIGLH